MMLRMTKPFRILIESELYTINKYDNIVGLEPEKELIFYKRMLALYSNALLPKSVLVLRGVSRDNLTSKLFRGDYSGNVPEDGRIMARLFYFGEKAKNYYDSSDSKNEEKAKWLKTIRDNSDKSNRKIFGKIKKLLKNQKNEKVLEFNEDRPIFLEFFSNKNNISDWLDNLRENIVYRDYYLYFLHTYGMLGTNGRTLHVSSTDSWSVAEEFSNGGFIVFYILPFINTDNGFATCLYKNSKIEKELDKKGMPTYDGVSLYKQREVTLKGAMFPHLIWGVYDKQNSRFIVNPYMFTDNQCNQDYKNPFLDIDQREFKKKLGDTNYLKGVLFDGDFSDIRI